MKGKTMIPIWMAPIALAFAAGGLILFIAAISSNDPPSLRWSHKHVLRPGFGVELNGKHYENVGPNPVEIIPLSDDETVVIKASGLETSVRVTP